MRPQNVGGGVLGDQGGARTKIGTSETAVPYRAKGAHIPSSLLPIPSPVGVGILDDPLVRDPSGCRGRHPLRVQRQSECAICVVWRLRRTEGECVSSGREDVIILPYGALMR